MTLNFSQPQIAMKIAESLSADQALTGSPAPEWVSVTVWTDNGAGPVVDESDMINVATRTVA